MKTKEIKINVYEVGDIVRLTAIPDRATKPAMTNAKRGLVIQATELKSGKYSYKVLTNLGNLFVMKPEEAEHAELICRLEDTSLSEFMSV